MVFTLVQVVLIAVTIGLALIVGYLLLLTAAALFAPRRTPPRGAPPDRRFLIVVPAHNEERLLPELLANLNRLNYPAQLYAIHVIADNCADRTADLARAGGAIVHERYDTVRIGKGYALQWLLEHVARAGVAFDAVLILDADSLVAPDFLTVMDARLAHGERAIQAYYAVRDPEQAWSAGMRAVALTVLHYLRPLGRMTLGGSAGLKGNGMVFAADVIRRYPWPAALTEDIEYHMALIRGGERVTFAPDAVVWAEMPGSLAAARSQNARWERGRLEMVRRYVPGLLRAAVARRSFLLFDAAVEQLIPPFSLVAAASVGCLLAALALGNPAATLLAALLIGGQVVYVFAGLLLARASGKLYRALLFTPIFVLWKIWLYARVLGGRDAQRWVRTARNEP